MKKIRINELARELEVKAHEILERLPELGVTEKKTHSSSIDEDVAIKLRRYYGFEVAEPEEETEEETEQRSAESKKDHSFARSFLSSCGEAKARPMTMWPPADVWCRARSIMRGRIRPVRCRKCPTA